MAGGQNEINYYRIFPQYDLQARWSWLNIPIKEIINCVPVQTPSHMTWLWQYLENDDSTREHHLAFWLNKRPWFTEIHDWDDDNNKYETTDIKEINWMFYAYKRSDNGKWIISKIINRKTDYCWWRPYQWRAISPWNQVWEKIHWEFDLHPCNPLNMTKVQWPTDYKDDLWDVTIKNENWIGTLTLTNYTWANIDLYDYIFVYDGVDVIQWQYKQVVGIQWTQVTIAWPRAGLVDWQTTSAKAKFYWWIGESLLFAGEEGIFHLSPDDSWYNDEITLLHWTKSLNNKPIRSLVNYWWRIVFEKWWIIFFWDWWENMAAFSYSVDAVGNYDDLILVWQYIVALGPSNIWIIYNRWIDDEWRMIPRLYEKNNNRWYRNRWSYLRESYWFDSRFVLFDNYGSLASYNIIPMDTNDDVYFVFERSDIWQRFVGGHLNMLTKEWDERVFISENNDWLRIFINYGEKEIGMGTKVLLFDRQQSFRYVRIAKWITMRAVFYWFYYGNKIFANYWDTDDWNEITQIITFWFWDISSYDIKMLQSMNLMLWYKTTLTGDKSFIRHNYNNPEWFAATHFYRWTELASQYIKLLNKYKWIKTYWIRDIKGLLEKTSMDRAIYSDPVISNWKSLTLRFHNEIEMYSDLVGKTKEYFDWLDCHESEPYLETDAECGEWWDYQDCDKKLEYEEVQKINKQNHIDKSKDNYLEIAKYAQIHIPIRQAIIESTFMLVAGEWQNIEFLWATVWFMQTDSDLHKRDNEWIDWM